MKRRLLIVAVFLLAGAVVVQGLVSCSDGARYEKALQSGNANQFIREFQELFPLCTQRIGYYSGKSGHPTWTSKIGLRGRFILSLQIGLTLNDNRTKIVAFGEPDIFVYEITGITEYPTGQTSIESDGQTFDLSPRDWKTFVESGGDLTILGIDISRPPVEGFERHWR